MQQSLLIGLLSLAHIAAIAGPTRVAPPELLSGTYTNEEQVYFDTEAGRKAPTWSSIRIHAEGDEIIIEEPDAFGTTHGEPRRVKVARNAALTALDYGTCKRIYLSEKGGLALTSVSGTCADGPVIKAITRFALTVGLPDGSSTELRRARPVSCWVAILKDKPKADGKEDWYYKSAIMLHDQGGRAAIGGGDTGAQPVIIRLRNVTWDKGSTNAPVVTLYVHKPDKPDHAEAYSWAAPSSSRVGINLRWVQSGCSIDAKPSVQTATKFKG